MFSSESNLTIRPGFLRLLQVMVCMLILVVTWKTVAEFVRYFPADFSANFLQGRENNFHGSYQWAFYPHIVVGPLTLIVGMVLLSDRFRMRYSRWHVRLGKLQIASVLLILTPSGFWMSFYAQAEIGVKLGFVFLSLMTGFSAWCGWKFAVQRNFIKHRLWMQRCYLLLCSAVVTRIIGGALTVTGITAEWTYYLSAWASWGVPLIIFESGRVLRFVNTEALSSRRRESWNS